MNTKTLIPRVKINDGKRKIRAIEVIPNGKMGKF